jgi:hypothetical protein
LRVRQTTEGHFHHDLDNHTASAQQTPGVETAS